MKWLPIETAPKDGTHILLAGKDFVMSGQFDSDPGLWFDSRGMGYEWEVWGSGELNPTHWMPLPECPK